MSNSPFLVCPFEIKSIKEDNPDYYIVEGYASVYGNVDLGGDVVDPGAFSDDLLKRGSERPILWQHNAREPIGVGTFTDANEGLQVVIKLPSNDDFVSKRCMPQIKCGSVKGLSIGYRTEDYTYDQVNQIRRLKKLKLIETSAVTFPMNELAMITAAKEFLDNYESNDSKIVPSYQDYDLADEGTKWDKSAAVKQIRTHTNSTGESPSKNYKRGFMYYDATNEDKFTGYKLPYVYWVDGKFKAVPKALSAIVGAMAGPREGLKIPDADKNKIKSQINKYYKKMNRESPFKSDNQTFIDIQTLKEMDKRDYCKLFEFDNNIILSTQAKEYVIESLMSYKKDKKNEIQDNGSINELIGSFSELNKYLNN